MASRARKRARKGKGSPRASPPAAAPALAYPSVRAAPTWVRVVLPSVVVAAAFVTFLPALEAGFVTWDDDKLFLNNPDYRGLGWSNIRWMFKTTTMGHWQPLSWMTLGLDHLLYGVKDMPQEEGEPSERRWQYSEPEPIAWGYHLTNMLLHAGCAAAFYFLAVRLLVLGIDPRNQPPGVFVRLAAAMAALFFAVHPLRVESVAWVTERRDLLSGLFFILTINLYLKSRTAAQHRPLWYGASLVVFILSVLSKAWGMTLPAILLVLDVYPLRRLRGRLGTWFSPASIGLWLEKIPFAIIATWIARKAIVAQEGQLETVKSLAEHPLLQRTIQVLYGAAFYPWKTLLPLDLIPLYELLQIQRNPWQPRFVIGAAAVVVILAVLVVLRRRGPAGLALGVCYLAVFSPVSGVAQSGPQLVKDSYSYLCCLSWALLFGGALLGVLRRWGARGFAAATCVGTVWVSALGVASWRQTGIWRDSMTLWSHTVRVDDRCALGHNNLAILLRREGQLEASERHYQRSLEIDPDNANTYFNLANCLKAQERYDEAIEHFKRAIELQKRIRRKPVHDQAHLNLGNTYRTLNRIPEALEHHLIVARYRPTTALYEQIARELVTVGRRDEGEAYFRRALERNPAYFDAHYGLGRLLLQRGDCPGALEHLRQAAKLKPESDGAAQVLAQAEARCGG